MILRIIVGSVILCPSSSLLVYVPAALSNCSGPENLQIIAAQLRSSGANGGAECCTFYSCLFIQVQ